MDLSPIILAMAEAEGPSSVLGQVVAPLLEHDEIVLTRVWFMDDRDCTVCQGRRDAASGTTLHLRAHGSRLGSATSGAGLDGAYHLVRVGTQSRIAEIAARGEALLSSPVEPLDDWGVEATWPVISEIRGVLGFPLRFRGRVVGVLACYLRTPADEGMLDWLPMFAAHAAVAIANCRALQEIQHLQTELELERDYLREEAAQVVPIDGIVGDSEALKRVLRQVDLVAATEANVLLQGESGTGKELIARAIHQRSPRAGRSMVKVNCASIPRELFESEFFGHVRGAFTGAINDRVGRFQLADRGTLFLDEIGEIPLELQTKLLRVLQEGEFERVGEDTTRHVNVRVMAATNRDLRAEVDAGRFRPGPVLPLERLPSSSASTARTARGHYSAHHTVSTGGQPAARSHGPKPVREAARRNCVVSAVMSSRRSRSGGEEGRRSEHQVQPKSTALHLSPQVACCGHAEARSPCGVVSRTPPSCSTGMAWSATPTGSRRLHPRTGSAS